MGGQAEPERERKEPPPTLPVEEIGDTRDVLTTEDVEDTGNVLTVGETVREIERERPARRAPAGAPSFTEGQPREDEEVNPVGSYETWDQSGQSLDAAGAGMTGDEGTVGLTGTGFEDDAEVRRP